ncbi:EAL domain-containing protein [Litorivicinus lipolyticus]|uniref:EAL domain-containing protein n=1 Tax=Litorivicinus lipolyticus TaxID=418701 RepID=A0A5Q2QAS9_9GAMM|nr:EAL domain-containing protein [Litorivicinus lipolyticus]QGG79391.1 EAL domain-containing protein [Litorivicinus lipolyticus]
MSWYNRLTVRVCALLFALLVLVFGLFGFFVDNSLSSQEPNLQEYLDEGRTLTLANESARSTLDIVTVNALVIADAFEAGGLPALERVVASIASDPWIRQVSVYGTEGEVLAETRPTSKDYSLDFDVSSAFRRTQVPLFRVGDDGRDVSAWAPVWGDDANLGAVYINRVVRDHSFIADTLDEQVMQVWKDLSATLLNGLTRGGGLALLVTMLAVVQLSREISRPYRRLEAAFDSLGSGRRVRLRTTEGPAEARRLSDRFNHMAGALETANDKVRELAFTDGVTGLPNRAAVMERLERLLSDQSEAALLFVDLDDFKRVNDVFGHEVGDITLSAVADRLRGILRQNTRGGRPMDMVARLGGDEFVVLITPPPSASDLGAIADRLIKSVCAVIEIENRDIFVGASVGIAIAPHQGTRADTLLRHADMAMYEAKSHGKRQYSVFDKGLETDVRRMALVETHLRTAVENGELRVEYQPIMDGSLRRAGYEALVRWTSPTLGPISPGEFIPVAEAYGMIEAIDLWIAQTAINEMASYVDEAGFAPFLSLNMSGHHFVAGTFTKELLGVVAESGIEPSRLHVEITEAAILQDESIALGIVRHIRGAGVKVFLDDFGTGYSSLSHLANFDLDGIKIDVSFVRGIPDNPGSVSLTAGLIALAHNLELEVVAEGVEMPVQAEFLLGEGCDYLQGWLYAKAAPLPRHQSGRGTLVEA